MAITGNPTGDRARLTHPAVLVAGLVLLTTMLYWKVQHYQFVGLDDHVYVWNNPYVINGITWDGITYVFSNPVFSTYHPLTWLSLMADSSLFGLAPQSYHRTSIALHVANVVLVFLFLRRATGAALPAAFVAALFAIHPLNVEPVAWVSSRKDVLSAFFFLLGLWAYTAIPVARMYLRITLVTLAYVLSLLAKPSAITFPFVLLLLDLWPLARYGSPPTLHWKSMTRFAAEKAPLFAVLLIAIGATLRSVDRSLAINAQIPLATRLQDAIVNYALYLGKVFAPIGLSAHYPYDSRGWPMLIVIGSAIVLIAITAAAWRTRHRHPFIAVGWLWYLGVMVPLCGILIVGTHNRADRYMYIPIIGLLIVITWAIRAAAQKLNTPKPVLTVAAIVVLGGYTAAAWRELPHWENEKALAEKMLDAHDWNPMGHYLLGSALESEGDIVGALKHFQRQLQLVPNDPAPHMAIGNIQLKLAAYDDAARWYLQALERDPASAEPYYRLATLEMQRGNLTQARQYLEHCLRIQPYHQAAAEALAALNSVQTPANSPENPPTR